jgi:hypothetical protein
LHTRLADGDLPGLTVVDARDGRVNEASVDSSSSGSNADFMFTPTGLRA